MVARDEPGRNTSEDPPEEPEEGPGDLASVGAALFAHWRRSLTWLVGAAARGAREAGSAVLATARYLLDPRGVLAEGARPRLSRLGLAGLGLGAVLSVALSPVPRLAWRVAAFDAVWMLAWAPIRLLVLRLTLAEEERARPGTILAAWAPALLPFALGVVGPARWAAFLASAWLTYAGTTGLGVSRRRAGSAIALAFGAQAAVEVVRWLGRGVVYLVLHRIGYPA
jgi:hypothetical protein